MKRLVLCALILMFACAWTFPTMAAKSVTETQKQKNQIDSNLNSLNKKKKEEQQKLNNAKAQKKTIESTQKQQNAEYQKLVEEAKRLDEEVKKFDDAVKDAEESYINQKELFKTRLKVMYENSDKSYFKTLIEAKNISDFLERLELVSRISKRDKDTVEALSVAKKDVEYKKSLKEEQQKSKQQEAGESQKRINTLQVSRANLDDQIRKINSTIDELEKKEDDLIKKSEELASQIRDLQKKGTKYTGGSMRWPTPGYGRISSYYGNRLHPILKRYKMHTGLDINAPSGASIIAANKGTVIYAGWQSGYGNTVIIDHGGGISTLYGHCSKLLVKTGNAVEAGANIARVGSTGLSTGPHLHFEVRTNGATTDPLKYVSL